MLRTFLDGKEKGGLVVSRLANRLRHHAAQAASHEANLDRLYTMSHKLLIIDRSESIPLASKGEM